MHEESKIRGMLKKFDTNSSDEPITLQSDFLTSFLKKCEVLFL
jgi:hypothetical protein